MDIPTQQQMQEFVEWCGATRLDNDYFTFGDKSKRFSLAFWRKPTLDFLFEHAVPKVIPFLKGNDHEFFGWKRLLDEWLPYLSLDEDSALALFWILWKVKEKECMVT